MTKIEEATSLNFSPPRSATAELICTLLPLPLMSLKRIALGMDSAAMATEAVSTTVAASDAKRLRMASSWVPHECALRLWQPSRSLAAVEMIVHLAGHGGGNARHLRE